METCKEKLLPCIIGPTAAGKSQLALQLAAKFNLELLSVDSVMVYHGMDIGTAKPESATLKQYPHHMIDIRDPGHPYSAADFATDASKLINSWLDSGRMPLLVGGSMLYFHALFKGLSPLPRASATIRAKITAAAELHGWNKLHQELAAIDPEAAKQINPNDPQRIQRALEVYHATGKNLSSFHGLRPKPQFSALNIAIAPSSRQVLHQLIADRFDEMLAQGLVDEVAKLYARADLHAELPAIRAVGYRQVWQYLAKEIDYATMRERAIIATRQLAKRQYTWLRQWPDLHWFDSEDTALLPKVCALLKKHGID
jgi:tRNA dimethylallyltransferase